MVPAPMSGYGDRAWREMCRRMGCDLVVVPIISADGLIRDDAKTAALIDTDGEAPPVAVQLFGKEPASMAEAARRIEAAGHSAVDLNLGCPAKRVVRHEGGSALLKNPDQVRAVVAAMRAAVSVPLTVKLRASWDGAEPGPAELARIVEGEGADALAIHARTSRQMYTGRAHWPWIAEAKEAVNIPVIGNGDILKGEDAARMIRETGCDAAMVGRGMLGNPWLLRDALTWVRADGTPDPPPAPPSAADRLATLVDHARLMARHLGEPRGVILFRKHAVRYVKGLRNSKVLKQALTACETVAAVEEAVAAFLERTGEEDF